MKRQMKTKRARLRQKAQEYIRQAEWCKVIACDYYLANNLVMEQYWEAEYRRFEQLAIQTQEEVLKLYSWYTEDGRNKRRVTPKTAKSERATASKNIANIIPQYQTVAT